MTSQSTRVGKQHILETAEDLFSKYGFQAVSIRAIAEASGVTNAALYYHFEGKEALFKEVLVHHAERLAGLLQQASAGCESLRDKLLAMLTEYTTHITSRSSPVFLLRHKSKGLDDKGLREQHGQLIHLILAPLENVLAEAVSNGEMRPLPEGFSAASLLIGMIHGLAQHRRMCARQDVTPEDIGVVVDVFWDGMRLRQESPAFLGGRAS
jgi:AcrR family transcriptional regulator